MGAILITSVLARLLNRMVLVRFLAIIFGVSLFVLTLEAVTYGNEIVALAPDNAWIMAKYLAMRMPATLATFLPLALLLAMLLTLTELSLRNETVAIWATGISPARIIGMLMPLIVFGGVSNFILLDKGVPYAAPTLRQWAIGDYGKKRLNVGEDDPVWMRNGPDIIRAQQATGDPKHLTDVVIFKRDSNGLLTQQISAKSAEKIEGGWRLIDSETFDLSGAPVAKAAQMTYSGLTRPATTGSRSGDPEEMSISELGYFIKNHGFGIRPEHVFQTWRQKRLASLATALVIIALCIPFAVRTRRGGGLGSLFVAGVALGFLYFICEGISLSLGVTGYLTPWLAAWLPNMAFGALAVLLLLRQEKLKV